MAWSVYAEAMRVPVVSLIMAARVTGRFYCLVSWRFTFPVYHRAYLLPEGCLKLRNNVKALHAVNVEAFGPSL
jgi:hypothetical protein